MLRKKGPKAKFEQTRESAISAAIYILAYSDNTENLLFKKLQDRGYSEENAAAAVEFVVEKGYLDEERIFLRFVENCATVRKLGRGRITQEAKRKGFSEKTFEKCGKEAFENIDFDELCLKTLLSMRYSDDRKAATALFRKGYSMGNIRYALEHRNKDDDEGI